MTPRPPDRERVEALLARLRECIRGLESLELPAASELTKDRALMWAAERGLQLALQIVLDTGAHLLAARGHGALGTYRDVLEGLGVEGVLPGEFARRIAGMAGMRNALVHGYASLDPERIHECATNCLEDFEAFAHHVIEYLDR